MVDWSRVVLDLHHFFGSIAHLCRQMKYGNPDYLRHLESYRLTDPKYSIGSLLLEMYQKHIKEDIPMIGGQQKKLL